ncbi:MFS transporter [Pandoraea pnomenusa]|uniref:MFS transporter n=1 Tax=Pandoraea pnomenusa TaxID=93220 RepID=UPI001AC3FAA9|nr:MFS transporter [Pandoraea pnomenusa]MBN9092387.1 MFS transporter [Pandoraea pnomenusa]
MAISQIESRSVNWRGAIASTIGNMLEWYDFIIFGFLSILISKQFFPAADTYTSILFVTATTGAGLIFRPIGGILIGMYADRVGRRQALMLVIMLMTLATLILAFTPTYAQIGVGATVLVVLARILQGISAGGEFGTATALLVEYAPESRRNLFGSFQMFAQCFGSLVSACMGALLTNVFSPAELEAWAWRIPFVLGLIIGPYGMYLRRNLTETEDFKESKGAHKGSLKVAIAKYPRELAVATALSGALNVMGYVLITYVPIYAVANLGLKASVPFNVLVVAVLVRMAVIPIFGLLADRVGGAAILKTSLVLFLIVVYPCFYWVINQPGIVSLMVAEVIFATLMGAFQGPVSTLSAQLFPVEVRSTALSLSYNIGASLLGGLTPPLLTWLIHATGDMFVPAHYCAVFFLLGIGGLLMVRGAPAADPRLSESH